MSQNRAVPLVQVRITLDGVEPEVWRLLEIGDGRTLSEVHDALQIAMGWTDSHLHLFEHPDGRRWSNPDLDDDAEEDDERQITLAEVLEAGGLGYEYDFGDSWSHRIELVGPSPGDATRVVLLDGARSAPPEDCGGVGGYARLLSVLTDPSAEDHDELTEWLAAPRLPWGHPARFDSEALDVDAVNRRLRQRFEPGYLTDSWGYHLREVAHGLTPGALTAFADHLERAELQRSVTFDADLATDAVRPFAWLLDQVGDGGLKLTGAGRLPPVTVRAACQALGWDRRWMGAMNREDHVPMAAHLREWATRTTLVRKYRGALLLTQAGQAVRDDPSALLHHLAERALQIAPKGVSRTAGVLLLAELATGAELDLRSLSQRVASGLHLLGYADEDRWSPPPDYAAMGFVAPVWGLLGMLGLAPSHERDLLLRSREALTNFARVALREE